MRMMATARSTQTIDKEFVCFRRRMVNSIETVSGLA
jgi:hypothetical protein